MALRTGQDGIRSYVSLWPVTVYIVSCPCRTRYQLLFVPLGTPVGTHVHSTVIKNLFSLWGYRPIWGFASRYACGKDSLCFRFWERTLVWQSVNKWWSVTASTHWTSSVSKLFQVTEEGLNTSSRSTRGSCLYALKVLSLTTCVPLHWNWLWLRPIFGETGKGRGLSD